MKQFIVALVLIGALVLTFIINTRYTEIFCEDIIREIEALSEASETASENDDTSRKISNIDRKYKDAKFFLSLSVDTHTLDKISEYIFEIEQYYLYNENAQYLAVKAKLIYLFGRIIENEAPSLYNII